MAEVCGAALGAGLGELLKKCLHLKKNGIMFKSTLINLQSILKALDPLIKEIAQQNNELDRPMEELESLENIKEKGKKLIFKCSQIHKLNYFAKIYYQKKLETLLDSVHRFLTIQMLAQLARDQKETLIFVRKIHNKIDKIEDTIGKIHDSIEMQLALENATTTNYFLSATSIEDSHATTSTKYVVA